jgi:hypothetical protein
MAAGRDGSEAGADVEGDRRRGGAAAGRSPRVYMSAQGVPFTQALAQ